MCSTLFTTFRQTPSPSLQCRVKVSEEILGHTHTLHCTHIHTHVKHTHTHTHTYATHTHTHTQRCTFRLNDSASNAHTHMHSLTSSFENCNNSFRSNFVDVPASLQLTLDTHSVTLQTSNSQTNWRSPHSKETKGFKKEAKQVESQLIMNPVQKYFAR